MSAELAADIRQALKVARSLIRAGVPVFAAEPATGPDGKWDPSGGTDGCGYWLPKAWEKTVPSEHWLDPSGPLRDRAWHPGYALGAVMGHRLDLLDVDPRNGGDSTRAGLVEAGMWPTVYGLAETPSGGTHEFVAPLGTGSRDAVRDGLDVKGGTPEGTGRGFAFIAPTVKASKVTGELVAYSWRTEPDLVALAEGGDDSGEALAEMVRQAKGKRVPGDTSPGERPAWAHGPIPDGKRYPHLRSHAGFMRDRSYHLDDARVVLRTRWQDCAQPPHARSEMPWEDAEALLEDIWSRYAVGEAYAAVTGDEDPDARLEAQLAFNRAVADEAHKLRVRQEAARVVRQEALGDQPAPDVASLAELLARPVDHRWRIDGLLPAGGRLLLSAQRKTGKTIATGNMARSLLTGEPFLGRFDVTKLDGRIVVLNYEVTGEQYAAWMDDIGVPHNRLYVVNLRGRRNLLADDDGRAELAEIVHTREGQVMTVDPFGRSFTGKSQNDAAEVAPWLVRLDEVAEQAGCTELILTAHAGWDGERTRGSSALEDWPDSIVTMTRDPDTGQRFIKADGRDVDLDEDRLDYDPVTRRLSLSGAGNRKKVRKDGHAEHLAEAVRDIVTEAPGINTTELTERLRQGGEHLQREDTAVAVHRAEDRGWVHRERGPRNAWLHQPGPVVPSSPEPSPGTLVSSPDPSYRTGLLHALPESPVVPDRDHCPHDDLDDPMHLADCEIGGAT